MLCGGEGQDRGPEEGLLRQRAAAGGRQHPAPDRRVPLSRVHSPCPSRSSPGPRITDAEESPMPRIIEVTVSPRGEATVQTKGYAGGDCLAASRFIEQALGLQTAESKTAEFYQGQSVDQALRQSQ